MLTNPISIIDDATWYVQEKKPMYLDHARPIVTLHSAARRGKAWHGMALIVSIACSISDVQKSLECYHDPLLTPW